MIWRHKAFSKIHVNITGNFLSNLKTVIHKRIPLKFYFSRTLIYNLRLSGWQNTQSVLPIKLFSRYEKGLVLLILHGLL